MRGSRQQLASRGPGGAKVSFHAEILAGRQAEVLRQMGTVLTLLHALAYFDDAEKERMPVMLWKTSWQSVKQSIRSWVREIAG
jgi:hypothetical protein